MNGSMHGLMNGLSNGGANDVMRSAMPSGDCPDRTITRTRPDGPRLIDRLIAGMLVVSALRERVRQRRRLLALASEPGFLKDVGLSRTDALQEADKPFWRP